MSQAATRLRRRLQEPAILQMPLVHDALSAKIAEAVGFEAVFVSGNGVSSTFLAMPDAGFLTLTEVVTVASRVAASVSVPVVVDCDTGYGNALGVIRTVREMCRIGVAGMLLEDQVSPKRSEFVAGIAVLPEAEAVGKVRAAVDARKELGDDLILIARTDARVAAGGSVEDAIRRANLFLEAGADVIFVAAPQSYEEVERYVREIDGPCFCPLVQIDPVPSLQELQELGMAINFAGASHPVMAKALWDHFSGMFEDGPATQAAFRASMKGHPLANFHGFIGFDWVREMEDRYLPADQVEERYRSSIGYKG